MESDIYVELGVLSIEGEIYPVFFEAANRGKTYYLKDGNYHLITWNWTK